MILYYCKIAYFLSITAPAAHLCFIHYSTAGIDAWGDTYDVITSAGDTSGDTPRYSKNSPWPEVSRHLPEPEAG